MYVLEELWQLVQSLPPDGNAALVDYTKRRLGSKSPIVKQKVRRVTNYKVLQRCSLILRFGEDTEKQKMLMKMFCLADSAHDQAHLQQG